MGIPGLLALEFLASRGLCRSHWVARRLALCIARSAKHDNLCALSSRPGQSHTPTHFGAQYAILFALPRATWSREGLSQRPLYPRGSGVLSCTDAGRHNEFGHTSRKSGLVWAAVWLGDQRRRDCKQSGGVSTSASSNSAREEGNEPQLPSPDRPVGWDEAQVQRHNRDQKGGQNTVFKRRGVGAAHRLGDICAAPLVRDLPGATSVTK